MGNCDLKSCLEYLRTGRQTFKCAWEDGCWAKKGRCWKKWAVNRLAITITSLRLSRQQLLLPNTKHRHLSEETCSIDFYIKKNHLPALEHATVCFLTKTNQLYLSLFDRCPLSWTRPSGVKVPAVIYCLICGGRSLGSLGRRIWDNKVLRYYVTEFICLAWLLTALTCIAHISHVRHLHSWSREASGSHQLSGPVAVWKDLSYQSCGKCTISSPS